ncbi:hypothetical protein H10PHJ05_92 [Aeromonas phage HJ05]|nr:hypothetical protein H10PHJ05_92 [Aeromonas phage HJ05]
MGWSADVVQAAMNFSALPKSYTLPPEVSELVPAMVPPLSFTEDSAPERRSFVIDNSNAVWDGMGARGMFQRKSHIRQGMSLDVRSECDIIRDAARVSERGRQLSGELSGRLTYKLRFDPSSMGSVAATSFSTPALTAASLQSISDVFTEVTDEMHYLLASLLAERITQSYTPPPTAAQDSQMEYRTGVPVVTTLVAPSFNAIKDKLRIDTFKQLKDGNAWRELLRSVAQEAVENFIAELTDTKTVIPFWNSTNPLPPNSEAALRGGHTLRFNGTPISRVMDRNAGGVVRPNNPKQPTKPRPARRRIVLPPTAD